MGKWSTRKESMDIKSGSKRGRGSRGRLAKSWLRLEHLEDRRVPALLLNEISVNPPATDNPFEYVELKDTPSATIAAGTYLVDFEGDGTGSGVADFVVDLSGASIGTSGLLVVKSPTGGHSIPSGTTVLTDAQLDTSGGGLENGTITFMLISSPTTAITETTDYDTNTDGVLEGLPGDAVILDAVGWTDGGAGDLVYGGVTLTQSSGTPDAASRFSNNTTPSSFAAWYNGDLSGATNDSLVYNPAAASANLPSGAALTPGATNSHAELQSTTTTIASDINPSVFGQMVTFTATVTAGSGTPTGSVEFFNGVTSLGTGTLDGSGQATLGTDDVPTGVNSITATYLGDSNYATSTSTPLSQTVNKADTTSAVVSSNNPSNFGASVTFTATVTATAPGAGIPTGTVEFFDGVTSLGTDTLDANGEGTFTTSSLSVGSHSITVSYLGDTNFNTSTSPALTQDVVLAAVDTTTTVVADVNPSVYGQVVTFTATVESDPPGQGTPTGTVEFFYGVISLGTDTLDANGEATLATGVLPAGVHSITATYSGDGTFNASTSAPYSQTVNQASTDSVIVSSLNPSTFGQEVTFTATVTAVAPGAGIPTGTVEFFDGVTSLGTNSLDGNGEATLSTSSLSVGSHAITAQYLGDSNFAVSTSNEVTQVVDAVVVTNVVLNEVAVNLPGGTDTPYEYIELRGDSGTALTNVYVVDFEGDGSGAGTADFVQDLSAFSIGSNGLLYIGATVGGNTIPAATTFVGNAGFNTGSGILENGTISFFVIQSSTPITQATDYDTNNDGVLELPVGATVIDAIGWTDGDGGDIIYGGVTLTQSSGTPDAASRFANNSTPLSFAAWYNGDLAGALPTGRDYDPAQASANLPAGAAITPGDRNSNPLVIINEVGINPPGTDTPFEYIELRGDPGTTLTNIYVVDFDGDGTFVAGIADFVQDLSAFSLGTNGLLYIGATAGGHTIPGATTFVGNSLFNTGSGALENGTISFLIIESSTPLVQGTDYDADNDGILELPTGAVIVDAVGWADADVGDLVYGGVTLTQSSGTPDGASRYIDNNSRSAVAAWYNADLISGPSSTVDYNPASASNPFPAAGAKLTPGDVNSNPTPVASTTAVVSSVNPSLHNQPVTFTATVSAVSGTPTGTVEFIDGVTSLGTDTLDGSGQASIVVTGLTIGTHSISAKYLGDVTYLASTSTPFDQVVNQLIATWVGGGAGDATAWSNPLNWDGGIVPTDGDKAIFTGPGTVSFTSVVDAAYTSTIGEVDIDPTWNGFLTLDSALTVTGTLDIDSGSITGNGAFAFDGGAWTNLLALVGTGGWTNNGALTMNATGIDVSGTGTFTNADTLTVQAGTPLFNATFTNSGTVEVLSGELQLFGPFTNFSGNTLTGGTYKLTGSLKFTGADVITNAAVLELTGLGSQIYDQFGNDGLANLGTNSSTGTITLQNVRAIVTAGNFLNEGVIELKNAARFTVNGTLTQNAGTTGLLGGGLKATGGVMLNGGSLVGRGSVIGNLTNNGGTVQPGGVGSTDTIRVNGTYVQGPGGTLDIEIGSLTAFDQFRVIGAVTLDGTMNVFLLGSYVPNNGDSFEVVTGTAGVTGTFATINGLVFGSQQFIPNYNLNDVTLVTAPFPAPPGGGRRHVIAKRSLADVVSKRTFAADWAAAMQAVLASADLDEVLAR